MQKKEKVIRRLQNLGRSIKNQINIMERISDSIISTDQYVDNSINIMLSDETPLELKEKIFHWNRKLNQTNAIKNVIDVYSYIHIVSLLQIYDDIEKNKEAIQRKKKYSPRKKKRK